MVGGLSVPNSKHRSSHRRVLSDSAHRVQPSRAHKEPCGTSTRAQHSTAGAAAGLAWPCRGARLLTLERTFGGAVDADSELWRGGGFAAEVWPDVPVASTWSGLVQSRLARLTERSSGPDSAAGTADGNTAPGRAAAFNAGGHGQERPWTIHTVAAQVRSTTVLEQRMRMLACDGELSRGRADALLCVSGSHPVRQLPFAGRYLPNSFAVLRLARQLKRAGDLPADLALLAAENPLLHHPSRLERKIEAGAQAVLTQPPLVWPRFEAWITEAHRRGLTQHAQVLVGVPLLASPANLAFWIGLCSAWRVPGMAAEMNRFREHAAGGSDQLAKFASNYNSEMITKVLAMPGVAGLHVMPLGKGARRLATQFFVQPGGLS